MDAGTAFGGHGTTRITRQRELSCHRQCLITDRLHSLASPDLEAEWQGTRQREGVAVVAARIQRYQFTKPQGFVNCDWR